MRERGFDLTDCEVVRCRYHRDPPFRPVAVVYIPPFYLQPSFIFPFFISINPPPVMRKTRSSSLKDTPAPATGVSGKAIEEGKRTESTLRVRNTLAVQISHAGSFSGCKPPLARCFSW